MPFMPRKKPGHNKPVASWSAVKLMESPENSACKCTRSLLFAPFPSHLRHLTKRLSALAGAQHRTVLGKREITLLAENAYTSASASGTFIIVNEYFTSVTLTSEPWRGESPRVSRNDGEIVARDRIPYTCFLSRKIDARLWLITSISQS